MPTASVVIDKQGERVRRMFAAIAGKYDLMNHLLSCQVDRYWRWRAVRLVPPRDATAILDVCTGTGDLALAYARASRGQVPLVATDFCGPMLARAREKSRLAQWASRIEWIEADTLKLPFPDNTFQIVSVAFGIRNVADTDQGLREMARVCKSGGRVAILEFSQPSWSPLWRLYGWYFRWLLPRIGQYLARNDEGAYDYLPASVAAFPTGEAFAGQMRAAGLTEVRCLPMTLGIVTLYLGHKPVQPPEARDRC